MGWNRNTNLFNSHKNTCIESVFDCIGSQVTVTEIMPKAGLVYSEKGNLSETLCKPKILPIKSANLEKIEELERLAATGAGNPVNPTGTS